MPFSRGDACLHNRLSFPQRGGFSKKSWVDTASIAIPWKYISMSHYSIQKSRNTLLFYYTGVIITYKNLGTLKLRETFVLVRWMVLMKQNNDHCRAQPPFAIGVTEITPEFIGRYDWNKSCGMWVMGVHQLVKDVGRGFRGCCHVAAEKVAMSMGRTVDPNTYYFAFEIIVSVFLKAEGYPSTNSKVS